MTRFVCPHCEGTLHVYRGRVERAVFRVDAETGTLNQIKNDPGHASYQMVCKACRQTFTEGPDFFIHPVGHYLVFTVSADSTPF